MSQSVKRSHSLSDPTVDKRVKVEDGDGHQTPYIQHSAGGGEGDDEDDREGMMRVEDCLRRLKGVDHPAGDDVAGTGMIDRLCQDLNSALQDWSSHVTPRNIPWTIPGIPPLTVESTTKTDSTKRGTVKMPGGGSDMEYVLKYRVLWTRNVSVPGTKILICDAGWQWRTSPIGSDSSAKSNDKQPASSNMTSMTRQTSPNVILATDNGKLVLLAETTPSSHTPPKDFIYETKCATITALSSGSVFGVQDGAEDIITGDVDGCVLVTSRQRSILNERMGASVTSVAIGRNAVGGTFCLAGDASGSIIAFDFIESLWKTRLGLSCPALNLTDSSSAPSLMRQPYSPQITCLLSTDVNDGTGVCRNVVLACNGDSVVHVLQGSKCLLTVQVPAPITSICEGDLPSDDGKPRARHVYMGTFAGHILELSALNQVKCLTILPAPITVVKAFTVHPPISGPHTGGPAHMIAAAGHFQNVYIFNGEQLVLSIPTNDWVLDLAIRSIHDGVRPVPRLALSLWNGLVETLDLRLGRAAVGSGKTSHAANVAGHVPAKASESIVVQDEEEEEEEGEISE
ncbi:hypothetical protein DFS34DRAFT_592985 [Phlyctochytrium arcticum]|nr:hypothetical protein DFS34DRAFT_592985 [Phlyctochytrium arcticum]